MKSTIIYKLYWTITRQPGSSKYYATEKLAHEEGEVIKTQAKNIGANIETMEVVPIEVFQEASAAVHPKKYKLLVQEPETGLYRIQALRDIPRHGVKAGDLGGFIEKEKNLSQDGDAWVSGEAKVHENAWVIYNAIVSGCAQVFGSAQVTGDSKVLGNAQVYENAWVSGDAQVFGNAEVYGNAWVWGNAKVSGNAEVYGKARVYGNAEVCGDAKVCGDVEVFGSERIEQ